MVSNKKSLEKNALAIKNGLVMYNNTHKTTTINEHVTPTHFSCSMFSKHKEMQRI